MTSGGADRTPLLTKLEGQMVVGTAGGVERA